MPRVKLFDEKEVLTKAMNLFWRKGYSATSVQDLVNHLGINRGSLYDTFGNKEQLFNESLALYKNSTIEGITQLFESHSKVKDGFAELFDVSIREVMKDKEFKGCFFVNTTTELIPNDEKIHKVFKSIKRDFENLFYKFLKRGKDSGELKTDHDLKSLASMIFILYNGMKVVSKINPKKDELKNSIALAMTLIC